MTKTPTLWAYEAPLVEEITILIHEDVLGNASLDGGQKPVSDSGDGGDMGDDFWN